MNEKKRQVYVSGMSNIRENLISEFGTTTISIKECTKMWDAIVFGTQLEIIWEIKRQAHDS